MNIPPPFSKIMTTYEADNNGKYLRVGQWFFNNYLRKMTWDHSRHHSIDTLYNSTDLEVIFNILNQLYQDYQWEM